MLATFNLCNKLIDIGKGAIVDANIDLYLANNRLTEEEYAGAVSWMELCGLTNGFTQDFSAATAEYIPDFDLEGL